MQNKVLSVYFIQWLENYGADRWNGMCANVFQPMCTQMWQVGVLYSYITYHHVDE